MCTSRSTAAPSVISATTAHSAACRPRSSHARNASLIASWRARHGDSEDQTRGVPWAAGVYALSRQRPGDLEPRRHAAARSPVPWCAGGGVRLAEHRCPGAWLDGRGRRRGAAAPTPGSRRAPPARSSRPDRRPGNECRTRGHASRFRAHSSAPPGGRCSTLTKPVPRCQGKASAGVRSKAGALAKGRRIAA